MRWGLTPPEAGQAIAVVGRLPVEAAAVIGPMPDALAWDSIDELALHGPALVVAYAPNGLGHGPLERLAEILDARDLAAIVACEAGTLDAVAAVLMTSRVTLLCDPSAGDWVTALALAAHRSGVAPVGVREGGDDAARLRALNAEVARIAALLADLVEPEPEGVDDRRRGYAAEPAAGEAVDPAVIRAAIRARRMRAQFFDARLLEDPGWDMLLDLFAAELEGVQVSVPSLCIAAGVAPTTALRWISRMADAGLFARAPDPQDRRRAFLVLSAAASEAMRGYAAAARRAGLPVV